jgi:hypothetical protein
MFNTVKPLSIILKGPLKKMMNEGKWQIQKSYLFQIIWGELHENYHYSADFSFKLWIIKVFEITT